MNPYFEETQQQQPAKTSRTPTTYKASKTSKTSKAEKEKAQKPEKAVKAEREDKPKKAVKEEEPETDEFGRVKDSLGRWNGSKRGPKSAKKGNPVGSSNGIDPHLIVHAMGGRGKRERKGENGQRE